MKQCMRYGRRHTRRWRPIGEGVVSCRNTITLPNNSAYVCRTQKESSHWLDCSSVWRLTYVTLDQQSLPYTIDGSSFASYSTCCLRLHGRNLSYRLCPLSSRLLQLCHRTSTANLHKLHSVQILCHICCSPLWPLVSTLTINSSPLAPIPNE